MITKKIPISLLSLLAIFLFASIFLSACTDPSLSNVALSPTPNATSTNTLSPFPSLGTQGPGWHTLFHQENFLPAHTRTQFVLGNIPGKKTTSLTFVCQGTGNGSIQLLIGSQIKNSPMPCIANPQPSGEEIDANELSSFSSYPVQIILVGEAHWAIQVEQHN